MQNIPVLFGQFGTTTAWTIGGIAAFLFVFFMFVSIWASRYTKVGPNQVLVISGRRHRIVDPDGTTREVGFRIVKGGGVFVWPVYEKVDILSLELLTIDVQTPEVYTSKGVLSVSMAWPRLRSRGMTSPFQRRLSSS
jgi:flotillin